MRWLLLKDLKVLKRSPAMLLLLTVYPLLISLLVGLALSRDPAKPTVALTPSKSEEFKVGSDTIDTSEYTDQLLESIDVLNVPNRSAALKAVKDGDAVAALIVPPDLAEKLSTGLSQPEVEVIYNVSDPVKTNVVENIIKSKLTDANQALSGQFTKIALTYIDLIVKGGDVNILGQQLKILGLEPSQEILDKAISELKTDPPVQAELERVRQFSTLAAQNLSLSGSFLQSVGSPLKLERTVVSGKRTPLDAFAVAVTVLVSLAFIAVLLAAGIFASEREENTLSRLLRGLLTPTRLVLSKVLVAALCSLVVSSLLLVGVGLFIPVQWSRAGLWIAALLAGSLSLASLGVAIGAFTKDVRAASLLALLLTLPLTFLALVPEGAVSGALYAVVEGVSAVFPFKPALDAVTRSISDTGTSVWTSIAHSLAVGLLFTLLATASVRKLSSR